MPEEKFQKQQELVAPQKQCYTPRAMSPYKYIRATQHQNDGPPPVWFMRQAGRYMPEYRALRQNYSFKELMKTPELACEITLQPIDAFGMDAAILFSDILSIPDALGCPFDFIEKRGPVFDTPIRNLEDLKTLSPKGIQDKLHYVYDSIALLKPELEKRKRPLIGFTGAPFTVASYMIEGQSSSDLKTTKTLLFNNPDFVHSLLDLLSTCIIEHLNGQIKAGVHALQLFDTWTDKLSYTDFKAVSLPYLKRIIQSLDNPNNIPVTVFCKGSANYIQDLPETGCQVVSVDWHCDLEKIKATLPKHIALQGNFDPYLFYAPEETIVERITKVLDQNKNNKGYIFNLGHGIMPDTDPKKVKRAIDTIQQFR